MRDAAWESASPERRPPPSCNGTEQAHGLQDTPIPSGIPQLWASNPRKSPARPVARETGPGLLREHRLTMCQAARNASWSNGYFPYRGHFPPGPATILGRAGWSSNAGLYKDNFGLSCVPQKLSRQNGVRRHHGGAVGPEWWGAWTGLTTPTESRTSGAVSQKLTRWRA